MQKILLLCLTYVLLFSGVAFAQSTGVASTNSQVIKDKKCLFPKSRKLAPSWVCTGSEKSLIVTAVGKSAKSRAGMAHMQQMAAADARKNLALNFRADIQKRMAASEVAPSKTFTEQDTELMLNITRDTLEGSKAIKSAYGPKGSLFVLMGLDEKGAQKLYEAIVAEYRAQQSKSPVNQSGQQ